MSRRRSGPSMVHFTRAGIAKAMVDMFERIGCPAWRYLERAHISPALLENPEALVPVQALYGFVLALSRAEGIDSPGLRIAESMTVADFGSFGNVLMSARNLHDYFSRGCRLISTITTNQRYWIEFEGERVRFCHLEADVDQPLEAHLMVLGLTIKAIRVIVGSHWVPPEVTLPVGVPCRLAETSDAFANARTDVRRTPASFTFPESTLALRLPRPGIRVTDSGSLDFTTTQPHEFGDSVRRLVEALVLDGHADLQTASEVSGLSVRTLQRRLTECGMPFSSVVLESRISLSERWLLEPDRPITDIAHALGYSDSANFTRAFRRVNGLSPRAYRSAAPSTTDPVVPAATPQDATPPDVRPAPHPSSSGALLPMSS